jgi:hypothetical protein
MNKKGFSSVGPYLRTSVSGLLVADDQKSVLCFSLYQMLIKYLQLPFQFDSARMLEEVNRLAATYWTLHYQKLHYEGSWSAIPLRSIGGAINNIIIAPDGNKDYRDTVLLDQCPYIKEVLAHFKCPLLAVRLLKLDAGAVIKEHRDAELYFEKGEARLHIPVITDDEVYMYLDKERVHPRQGECWYMNFNLPHSIENKSAVNRIHLVMDVIADDWLKNVFAQPGLHKKEIKTPPMYNAETKKMIITQLRSMNTETANRMADEMEATDLAADA